MVSQPLSLRERVHEIVFEADTPAGRWFDVLLLLAITSSVAVVMLESVRSFRAQWGTALRICEWVLTVLFTAEYALRLWTVRRPLKYATSFFGVVDLLAVVPTYVSLFVAGSQSLVVIRALRLLRAFRILKLAELVDESRVLMTGLRASRGKIFVFLVSVLSLVTIVAAVMYLIEGEASGFTSIPRSLYWAVVTMTTVGYGDIAPQTPIGQAFAALVMILGYSIIAVPTGIISAEISSAKARGVPPVRACAACGRDGHDMDATHCKYCGERL